MSKMELIQPIQQHIFADEITSEIFLGLEQKQKSLPPKLFYDEQGSRLFGQITKLDAYYPTRTEEKIMERWIGSIVEEIGSNALLVEYGSGDSKKTELLLNNIDNLAAYVPIDISGIHLTKITKSLKERYPDFCIVPLIADYTLTFELPEVESPYSHKVAYFPGSTIGNFYPAEAVKFLKRVHSTVGKQGSLLIGVDLQKDVEVLNLAYNDPEMVTAMFNLNMLNHINQKYEGGFILENFRHKAFYNEAETRIEMHLVSLKDQLVNIAGREFQFNLGESILTEVSYKYTLDGFAEMANEAGFEVKEVWVDDKNYFSVQYLSTQA
ncbi:MAG: L-histidine N(alpha)-methyltransferase [Anaerolineae bacterium]|nr:L-histidine N(alpha)-methyltransferase [Anaerolineae bacterium]